MRLRERAGRARIRSGGARRLGGARAQPGAAGKDCESDQAERPVAVRNCRKPKNQAKKSTTFGCSPLPLSLDPNSCCQSNCSCPRKLIQLD